MQEAATGSERLYSQALTREAVLPEFEDAHPYLVSASGIRARATGKLAGAASGGAADEGFGEELTSAVEDYRLSDGIVRDHYVPAVREGLDEDGQGRYGGYLDETAAVVVEAGPVEYEKTAQDNTLKGTVTFGL